MTITINNKEFNIKYGFKAMMIYERIEDKPFNPQTLNDIITFFYCCVLAANSEIGFDAFIEWLDENPNAVTEFSNYLTSTIEAQTLKEKKATEKENQ